MKATLTIEDKPSRSKGKSAVSVKLTFRPAAKATTASLAFRLSLEAMAAVLKDIDVVKTSKPVVTAPKKP